MRTSILLVLSLLAASPAVAETSKAKSVAIFINPVGLLVGMADLGAEFATAGPFSLGPSFAMINYSGTNLNKVSYSATGYGGRLSWYFNGNAISQGWVLSAIASYFPSYKVTVVPLFLATEYRNTRSVFIGGMTLGYRWILDAVTLKLAFGVLYNNSPATLVATSDSGGTLTSDVKHGILPGGELQIGFAF